LIDLTNNGGTKTKAKVQRTLFDLLALKPSAIKQVTEPTQAQRQPLGNLGSTLSLATTKKKRARNTTLKKATKKSSTFEEDLDDE